MCETIDSRRDEQQASYFLYAGAARLVGVLLVPSKELERVLRHEVVEEHRDARVRKVLVQRLVSDCRRLVEPIRDDKTTKKTRRGGSGSVASRLSPQKERRTAATVDRRQPVERPARRNNRSKTKKKCVTVDRSAGRARASKTEAATDVSWPLTLT